MITVFALLALVAAQPRYGVPTAPQYGAPWRPAPAGPAYGVQAGSFTSAAQNGAAPSNNNGVSSSPPIAPTPSLFDIDQQALNLRAEQHFNRGNEFYKDYNPFVPLGAADKIRGQEVQLRRIRRARDQLFRTSKGTVADQYAADDIALQATATKDQIHRRFAQLTPGLLATPIAPLYEGRANNAQLQLARNKRIDAEQAYAKDPSQANALALRSARESVRERQQWLDANKADVYGFGTNLGDLGPLKRWQASETALDNALRDRRQKQAAYAASPSEDNWWDLRLSNVKLQALRQDIVANKGESLWFVGTNPSPLNMVIGHFLNAKGFDKEEDHWVRYQRLSLQNLQRKRAQGQAPGPVIATTNPVQAQMLALNNYGRPAAF